MPGSIEMPILVALFVIALILFTPRDASRGPRGPF
jgi:hypothetical protein